MCKTIVFSAIAAVAFSLNARSNAQEVDFGKQIRPLLTRSCMACHGPDEGHREADLRLDSFEGATDWAIVPGEPDNSEVVLRIESDDEDYMMPPPEHGHALTPDEVGLIKKWIESGAEYQAHWSFVKPTKSTVPEMAFKDWSRNEIDPFVAQKLVEKKLTPSGPADPHRLIRRLSLDLTGLPASPDMTQRFVDDPTDATYEKIVDELLASPDYGEHWTSMWLDIARYADSYGYASDENRIIWPWRDWVIEAFNSNMLFDQFTIQQIAGDLLPDPTESQQLATAFNRNTLNNTEGGTSDEEFRTIAVKDRISTTVNAWMGLTMRCAECHTHKYDPISHTEYYQFLDFFNQTADADKNDDSPKMSTQLQTQSAGESDEIAKLKQDIDTQEAKLKSAPAIWEIMKPVTVESEQVTELTINDDDSVSAGGQIPDNDEYRITYHLPPGNYTGLKLEALPDSGNGNQVTRQGNFVISKILATTVPLDIPDAQSQQHYFSDAAADFSQPEYEVKYLIGQQLDPMHGWGVAGGPGGNKQKRTAVLTFAQPLSIETETELTLTIVLKSSWLRHLISRPRFSITSVSEVAQKFRNKNLGSQQDQLAELNRELDELNKPVMVPIMVELPTDQHRETHINIRGSYLAPGEKVSAAVMKAFHPLPDGAPNNRLGVAQWLVSPENPLTARVTVNRFWAMIFGIGIVETEEDFGTQGTLPTHPELLDWLAVDFQQNGWDIKRLLKQIVTSSTYRQSNEATEQQQALDTRNRYYSRGPRVRLSAEVVRDQALAVSGLLSKKMYGPPVYPPSEIKKVVSAFKGAMIWHVSPGEDRYRRALYTYLKRSQPHPLFDTFDMATREVCSMRRLRTNTPLQSFMTLNDEAFIECAQQLAHKMHAQSGDSDQQINLGLETALCRPAQPHQIKTLVKLYNETLVKYLEDQDAAIQFAGLEPETDPQTAAELASLTVVGNVILNLDAFLTK